ncbi:hypothetical protein KP77_28600 [Jeotgalibacillus alimentarius]|uniref:Uncharacterized protein n=1 Tax=Jeotgalibacillus alimentarius TaxID=135826 RepID=A0A0C2VNJ6_9BACL|nr:hypothetical protein [Jeotgalibacillus alimentarius]KIL45568.1 hypothetical protein KP77_28600 [Jeotgalibacillus alimentarius]
MYQFTSDSEIDVELFAFVFSNMKETVIESENDFEKLLTATFNEKSLYNLFLESLKEHYKNIISHLEPNVEQIQCYEKELLQVKALSNEPTTENLNFLYHLDGALTFLIEEFGSMYDVLDDIRSTNRYFLQQGNQNIPQHISRLAMNRIDDINEGFNNLRFEVVNYSSGFMVRHSVKNLDDFFYHSLFYLLRTNPTLPYCESCKKIIPYPSNTQKERMKRYKPIYHQETDEGYENCRFNYESARQSKKQKNYYLRTKLLHMLQKKADDTGKVLIDDQVHFHMKMDSESLADVLNGLVKNDRIEKIDSLTYRIL